MDARSAGAGGGADDEGDNRPSGALSGVEKTAGQARLAHLILELDGALTMPA
ncbi:MAG TPA: hypothetical protein VMD29_07170 [Terracidiphilus sp.]|nr:hypothetical protein [Terracidiphilus sp.]